MADTVLYEENGAVATLTLNRPERYNAFDPELRKDLGDAIDRANASDPVRVVILKGAGKGFSAGNDLQDFQYDPISKLIIGEYLPLIEKIQNSPKIFIAQIHGRCAGVSIGVALGCDLATMAADSSIYIPFAVLGIGPDGGVSWHIKNALGRKQALAAILQAEALPAELCQQRGLVNEVFEPEELDAKTAAWAAKLAAGAPLSMAATKRILAATENQSLAEAIAVESEEQNKLVKSGDAGRAMIAFAQKKRPVFEGN